MKQNLWTIEEIQQTIKELGILFDKYDGEIDQHLLAGVKSAQWMLEDLQLIKLKQSVGENSLLPN